MSSRPLPTMPDAPGMVVARMVARAAMIREGISTTDATDVTTRDDGLRCPLCGSLMLLRRGVRVCAQHGYPFQNP